LTGIFPLGILPGMETLPQYLKRLGIPQSQFAVTVGITQSHLSKICSGINRPSLQIATRIEKTTAGAIPASSWFAETVDPTAPEPPLTPEFTTRREGDAKLEAAE
jgi:transcriptional regulator with XRE-family HTH domain